MEWWSRSCFGMQRAVSWGCSCPQPGHTNWPNIGQSNGACLLASRLAGCIRINTSNIDRTRGPSRSSKGTIGTNSSSGCSCSRGPTYKEATSYVLGTSQPHALISRTIIPQSMISSTPCSCVCPRWYTPWRRSLTRWIEECVARIEQHHNSTGRIPPIMPLDLRINLEIEEASDSDGDDATANSSCLSTRPILGLGPLLTLHVYS